VKLKKCPFCKQHAIRVSNPGHNWDGKEGKHVNIGALYDTWYVGCPAPFFESLVKPCEISPGAKWFASLEEAETAWNNRNAKDSFDFEVENANKNII
jgi:hypothetical protein